LSIERFPLWNDSSFSDNDGAAHSLILLSSTRFPCSLRTIRTSSIPEIYFNCISGGRSSSSLSGTSTSELGDSSLSSTSSASLSS
jgi:hypothetical protein